MATNSEFSAGADAFCVICGKMNVYINIKGLLNSATNPYLLIALDKRIQKNVNEFFGTNINISLVKNSGSNDD